MICITTQRSDSAVTLRTPTSRTPDPSLPPVGLTHDPVCTTARTQKLRVPWPSLACASRGLRAIIPLDHPSMSQPNPNIHKSVSVHNTGMKSLGPRASLMRIYGSSTFSESAELATTMAPLSVTLLPEPECHQMSRKACFHRPWGQWVRSWIPDLVVIHSATSTRLGLRDRLTADARATMEPTDDQQSINSWRPRSFLMADAIS